MTDALTAFKWVWFHIRRSDKAVQMGRNGFPDVVAARNGRVLMLELKTDRGVLSADQLAWAAQFPPPSYTFTYRVIRPADYDRLLDELR